MLYVVAPAMSTTAARSPLCRSTNTRQSCMSLLCIYIFLPETKRVWEILTGSVVDIGRARKTTHYKFEESTRDGDHLSCSKNNNNNDENKLLFNQRPIRSTKSTVKSACSFDLLGPCKIFIGPFLKNARCIRKLWFITYTHTAA